VRFEDFVLQFEARPGGFRARVIKSPFGEDAVNFSLPSQVVAEPAAHGAPGSSRDIGHQGALWALGARSPLEIGTELFRSVFQGSVRTLFDKSRGRLADSPDLGLRLKIKLDPSDEETSALADLPWELLCDGKTEDFFALSRRTPLVRYLDVPRRSQPIPFTPLRILAVGACPRDQQSLDLEEEMRRLKKLNRRSSGVKVELLPHASAGAVREALSGDTYNVLHFMGHGVFDGASGDGMLAFEGQNGSLELVSGKAFATMLKDLSSLGVVVLNACNTARARNEGGMSPFRGVATALVLGGIPAVVAMQKPLSDPAAIAFSAAFYRHLARGDSIDEALTEGRQAIHSSQLETFEWATPVLFLRIPEGDVFVKPRRRRWIAIALAAALGLYGSYGLYPVVKSLISARPPHKEGRVDGGHLPEENARLALTKAVHEGDVAMVVKLLSGLKEGATRSEECDRAFKRFMQTGPLSAAKTIANHCWYGRALEGKLSEIEVAEQKTQ